MILFPKLGAVYWIATDFWERFYSVPVTLEGKTGPGRFAADFNGMDYEVTRRELFRTQKAARHRADKLNAGVMLD